MTAVATELPRVLPADIYDALELSALAFGGIGAKHFNDYDEATGKCIAPRCIVGHMSFISGEDDDDYSRLSEVLIAAGLHVCFNDLLIKPDEDRISWDEYCRRGNIVRGEDQ